MGRTKCCRTVTERFSSVILHSFLSAGFREARVAPWNARVLPAVPPSRPGVRGLSSVGICLAGLIGCNRLIRLHTHIYIRILVFLFPDFFCVAGPLSCACFFVHMSVSVSLSFSLFSPTLQSKTPVVPPHSPRTRVATQQRATPYARNKRETDTNVGPWAPYREVVVV